MNPLRPEFGIYHQLSQILSSITGFFDWLLGKGALRNRFLYSPIQERREFHQKGLSEASAWSTVIPDYKESDHSPDSTLLITTLSAMAAKARNGCASPSQAPVVTPGPTARLQLTAKDPASEPMEEPHEKILQDGFWEYGRFYGSWKPGKYLFPIDTEELNRLDIFHKFFLVARDGKLFSSPMGRAVRPKIMDLGTGTGIWAINVAEDYIKDGEIMAVDLNQIQPALIPPGVRTAQFDLEDASWDPLLTDCDMIHLRLLLGSIHDAKWPEVYRKVFEHLEPGTGYMEQLEIDWTPQWEGPDIPSDSALKEWSDLFLRAMSRFRRSARVSTEETRRMVERAGFIDFEETTIRCYVNPWSSDRQIRETARWFNLGFSLGLEAMSMMPLIQQMGMTRKQVQDLCARVKTEICILRYHAYCTLHIWTAKRPSHP